MTVIRTRIRSVLFLLAAVVLLLTVGPVAAPADAKPVTSRDQLIGFVLDRSRVERIDLPADGAIGTALGGINNRGTVVGKYPDTEVPGFHGLVLDRRRKLTRIDYPRALATYVQKINDHGQVVGSANRTAPTIGTAGTFGYRLDRGRFTRIAYPDAIETQAFGVNNRGQVVGEYQDREGVFHGFRWQEGRFTTFDGPEDGAGASLTDINDRGDMVGVTIADDGTTRGFLLRNGRYRTFGALGLAQVVLPDINNRGQIAGTVISGPDLAEVHGFLLANGVHGPVTQIDAPGAPRTLVSGLDDRGRLVGVYENPKAAPTAQGSLARQPMLDVLPVG